MFDKDGDLREEPQDRDEDDSAEPGDNEEEGEQEEEAGEEAEEEEGEEEGEDEAEEDDSEEEEEPEAKLDWSKATPEHRSAFEASQKEVQKLRKDYGKLHSKYAELSQSRRSEDQSREQLQARAQAADEWNSILEEHPQLIDIIAREVKKLTSPLGGDDEVPEALKDDPAFKYMKERYEPYIKSLESKLKALEGQTKPLKDWESQQKRAKSEQTLNSILGEAKDKYKAMFKKDMSEEQLTQLLEYIVENDAYGNPKKQHKGAGNLAVLEVFGAEYEQAMQAANANRLREKAKKFGSRNKTVNSRQVAKAPKIGSIDDGIKAALAEQGMEV